MAEHPADNGAIVVRIHDDAITLGRKEKIIAEAQRNLRLCIQDGANDGDEQETKWSKQCPHSKRTSRSAKPPDQNEEYW